MNKGLIKITIIFGMLFTLFISMGVYAYCDMSNSHEAVVPTTEAETTTEIELETETETEIVELATQIEVETETETEPQMISMGVFKVTAYCSCSRCCKEWALNRPLDENGNPIVYGASGEQLIADYSIAVDVDLIPYGETILINGREYVAHDCGSAIYDNRIDIYMSSHEKALQWGVQYIEVFKVAKDILGGN